MLQADVGGKDLVNKIFREKSVDAVRSPEFRKFAEALDNLRSVLEPSEMVPLFADVGVQLVKGEAAGNIHGDWLQGDLQVLGGVPGENYECLPALGLGDQLSGGGDSFFFPKLPEGTDQAVIDAQTALAKVVIGKEAQLAFNLKKGSMPIRTDIDLSKANPCMTEGPCAAEERPAADRRLEPVERHPGPDAGPLDRVHQRQVDHHGRLHQPVRRHPGDGRITRMDAERATPRLRARTIATWPA